MWLSHVHDQPYTPDCTNTCGLQIQLNPQLDITDMPLKSFYKFALPEFAPSNGEPPCTDLVWISRAGRVLLVCAGRLLPCAAVTVAAPVASHLTFCSMSLCHNTSQRNLDAQH